MIPFDEALKTATNAVSRLNKERVALDSALGRILAEDVISDIDMPPFNKSAVDGFACRVADLETELTIIETIPAGKFPEKTINNGQCSRIMTGAPVPDGADCVVMVEHSKLISEYKVTFDILKTTSNICKTGEDVTSGMKLIDKGTLINPGHIAVMASAGYANPLVSVLPSVGVISTGDELVEPSEKPNGSQIRNSNAFQLIAQVKSMGCVANYYGIAPDTEKDTLDILQKSLSNNDVTLLTGGVSMGDFDFVPAVMQKAGLKILFQKIAIQPGKPTVLSVMQNKLCFGLPGNPVSSFVLFELLVKPVLYNMMEHKYTPVIVHIPFGINYTRKRSDRLNIIPVEIRAGKQVFPVDYHGSAHIHSMSFATGFVIIPVGTTEIIKGTEVDVRLI
jgi:molybdopterin molybdotransferase